jgi:DNA-binding CsgD family transcriptional regulator/DNA-binding Lrp family transcriptional regulator
MTLASAFSSTIRGRDAELSAFGEMLGRVRSGSGAVLLIEGAAGIGKSRLLAEGEKMAHRLGFPVGVGVAEPSESVAELAPLLRALFDGPEPLLDRAGLSTLDAAPEQRYWRLQGLRSLLERAATNNPLVVFLDDLQWAGAGTVAALRALPPRLASVPIGWILAMRPDQGSGHLRSLVEHLAGEGAATLVLEPLGQAAVAQVASDVMQAEPDDTLLRMAGEAGGNPFLLVELLEGLRQEELVRVNSGLATLTAHRLPDRVRASMRERLSRMSESARQVATVAGSLGRTFSVSELAEMLGLPPASLLTRVEELIEAGIVRDGGEQLSFQHDLVREAVRRACSQSARRALDRQAADVMIARGALPVEVAVQLAASAAPGDEVAITTLLAAAKALAMTDPGASADLSRRALELAPGRHPLRGPLVVQAAMSLHAAGRIEEAKAFADNAMRQVLPTAEEANVRLGIAGMWLVSPDLRIHASREALKLRDLPEHLRLAHVAKLAYNLMAGARTEDAQALLSEGLASGGCRDRVARFPLVLSKAGLQYMGANFAGALELLESVLGDELVEAHGLDELLTRLWRSQTLFALDREQDALQAIDEIIVESRTRGFSLLSHAAGFLHVAEITRGQMLLQLGRLEEASAALDARFDPHGPPVVTVMDASGVVALGRLALHTGDGRQIREASEIAKAMLNESTPGVLRHAAWLLSLQAMADGDPQQAHEWLCAMGEPERRRVLRRLWMDMADEPQMVRIALAVGDRELAESAVADAIRRAELSPGVPSLHAIAAHSKALLNGDTEQLSEAVSLFERSPRLLARAAAWEDLGLAHQRQGTADPGIDALTQALVLFTQAGATWDAARLRSRLRALGVRRRVATAEKPATGSAAMTKSELAVAQLAADGLTNREIAERLFVSPHTVNTHLRQVFAKLDVNSRVDLTRLAIERDSDRYVLVAPPLALAGGSLIFLAFLVVFFLAVGFAYYTRKGSGISQTPYRRDEGPPESPSELAHDTTQNVWDWGRGTAGHHGRHRPPPVLEPIDRGVADALRRWRKGQRTEFRLVPPVGPDDRVRGPEGATTVAIYIDVVSEPCRRTYQLLNDLRRRRPIRLAVRHLPLADVHPLALPAAETLEAARAQRRFFELLDQLTLAAFHDEAELLEIASNYVGDPARLRREVRAGDYRAQVIEHIHQATMSGAHALPEIYINGAHYRDALTADELTRALADQEAPS